MPTTEPVHPWIEIFTPDEASAKTNAALSLHTPPEPSGRCHATFAAWVQPLPMELRLKLKWGFSPAFLLDEAIERMQLFIEAQHPADDNERPPGSEWRAWANGSLAERRTLALRCVHDAQHNLLDLALVAKVSAGDEAGARQAALDYWHELQAIFPYDYHLTPIAAVEDYRWAAGVTVFEAAADLLEVRRFEGTLASGKNFIYLLGSWHTSNWANEQIWRTLASLPGNSVYSVTLRPTALLEVERFALAEMAGAAQAAGDIRYPSVQAESGWAQAAHEKRLAELRYPYIVQVHLAATQPIPAYVGRSIGAALAHQPAHGPQSGVTPGFEVRTFETADARQAALRHLAHLEPTHTPGACGDERFARLGSMMNAREALAAFRYPYPPEPGLPGAPLSGSK